MCVYTYACSIMIIFYQRKLLLSSNTKVVTNYIDSCMNNVQFLWHNAKNIFLWQPLISI